MRSLTPVLVWWSSLLAITLACTREEAKTVADVTTKLTDAVCKEEAKQPNEPDWVVLACAVEAPASGVVHVLLPRAQWDQARGKKATPCPSAPVSTFDAGPGK